MEQLTVDLGKDAYETPLPRSSPFWEKAIDILMNDTRVKNGSEFDALPIPRDIEEGWRVTRNGVPIRCLTGWVMFPLDGGPPGFRSRVDVLIIR